MEALRNFLQFSTPLDWLVITLAAILILAGIVLLIVLRSPKPFYFFLVVALLPLLLGLLTTYLKYQEVERMLSMVARDSGLEAAEAGRREAWIITYIAAVATAVLALIGLLGVILKKRGKA